MALRYLTRRYILTYEKNGEASYKIKRSDRSDVVYEVTGTLLSGTHYSKNSREFAKIGQGDKLHKLGRYLTMTGYPPILMSQWLYNWPGSASDSDKGITVPRPNNPNRNLQKGRYLWCQHSKTSICLWGEDEQAWAGYLFYPSASGPPKLKLLLIDDLGDKDMNFLIECFVIAASVLLQPYEHLW